MEGVEIHDIVSKPNEIIGLNKDEDEEPEDSYTRGQFVGPVGDIFSYDNCLSFNGTYESNILTNAQMFVKKHGMTKQEKGTTNISDKLMEWCESSDLKLADVMVNNNIYKVSGKDSMGHKMKGNIGHIFKLNFFGNFFSYNFFCCIKCINKMIYLFCISRYK